MVRRVVGSQGPGTALDTADVVLLQLLAKGPQTAQALIDSTGRRRTAVWEAIRELRADRDVVDAGTLPSDSPGRRELIVRAATGRRGFLGVAISGRDTGICNATSVLTDDPASHASPDDRVPIPVSDPESLVSDLVDYLRPKIAQADGEYGGVSALGLCIGGHIDASLGAIVNSPHFGWTNVALASMVEDALGIPTFIDNDVNALGLWESAFERSRPNNFVYILVGEGVGAALILNGDLFRGVYGGAGEIGHWKVARPSSAVCDCGDQGCLETFVSYESIRKSAVESRMGRLRVRDVIAKANSGNETAQNILGKAGNALGTAIKNVGLLLDAGTVVVSSTAFYKSTHFRAAVESTARIKTFSMLSPEVVWTPTEYSHAAIGAAWLAMLTNPRRRPSSP